MSPVLVLINGTDMGRVFCREQKVLNKTAKKKVGRFFLYSCKETHFCQLGLADFFSGNLAVVVFLVNFITSESFLGLTVTQSGSFYLLTLKRNKKHPRGVPLALGPKFGSGQRPFTACPPLSLCLQLLLSNANKRRNKSKNMILVTVINPVMYFKGG